jgi:hypothetical protein
MSLSKAINPSFDLPHKIILKWKCIWGALLGLGTFSVLEIQDKILFCLKLSANTRRFLSAASFSPDTAEDTALKSMRASSRAEVVFTRTFLNRKYGGIGKPGSYLLLVRCDILLVGCDILLVGCDILLVGCDILLLGCDILLLGCDILLLGCDILLTQSKVSAVLKNFYLAQRKPGLPSS